MLDDWLHMFVRVAGRVKGKRGLHLGSSLGN